MKESRYTEEADHRDLKQHEAGVKTANYAALEQRPCRRIGRKCLPAHV